MKKILSLFLALVILLSSVTVSLMFITSANASGNAIVNGGFENGLDDWTAYKAYDYYEMPAEIVTTEHNSGEKSLNYHNRTSASQGSRCLGQVVTLEPNSKYKLTFYLKGKPGWGSVALLDDLESNPWEFPGKVFRQQWSGDEFTTWTKHSYSFYTTEKTEYKFIIALTGTGTEAFLDDFVLELADPKPKDIIANGGFENGLDDWTAYKEYGYYEMPAEVVTTEHNSGEKSLNYHNMTSSSMGSRCLGQEIQLEPNTKYTLSFYMKGKPGWGNIAVIDDVENPYPWLFPGEVFKQLLSGGEFTTWTKHTYTFFSTDKTDYKFIIALTGTETEAFLDDIKIERAEPKTNEIISNGGFENDLEDWTAYKAYPYYEMPAEVVTTEKNTGEKSLNYYNRTSASIYNRALGQQIKLEANTKYTLSFYLKGKPQWGKIVISGDLTGKIWEANDEFFKHQWQGDEYNTWTKHTFTFFTDDRTDFIFAIVLTGANTEAYFDDIKIEKARGVEELVVNGGFEQDLEGWTSYKLYPYYEMPSEVVTTEKKNGEKSLNYYNRIYPWNCYYIKWVDVKPNTDYTFSAKYVITDVGDGFFGIAPGYKNDASVNESTENMLFPSNGKNTWPAESRDDMFIGYWDFTEENYNENQEWKSVGVTFNSGDRNRVGFFVQDGGGTAYIDDVRLFETKYAVKETVKEVEFPSNLEAKNEDISVENGFVKGVEADKTLSALAKSFKNSKYIRFFDLNGEEITDLSTKASTGIEARLMNGPVIKDRANIVVNGDVNGDGVLDSADADAIVKHITLDESLEWAYLEAADFDGDGEITVNDALFNEEASKSGSAKFVLTGPERIGVGKDIEVSLVADTNNAFAVSGKILFNNKMLTLKSVKTDLGKAWNISSVQLGGEVDFAAVNSAKDSGTVKDKAVITFTFTVGNVKTLEDVKVSLENGLAATSDKLLKLDNCSWPIIETEKDNTSNDNSSTDNDSNDVIIDNNSSDDKSEETTEITTIVKAANRLSVLKLDEAEISPEFDPEVREYTATVPYEIEKVTVTAIAENEDATVTIGDTNLEYIGKNAITITVVSADGLKRAYRIIVTREAPTASGKTDKDAGFPLWAIILIIVGAALLVAAVVFLLIIMKRRKKTA